MSAQLEFSTLPRQWGRILETPQGCWEWQGANNQGYGAFSLTGKLQRVTRIVYRIFHGRILKGHEICHKCDNPRCCNPQHIYAGTHADNMQDRARKGRWRRTFNQRLTLAKAAAIRAEYAVGNITHAELAEKYNAHINTIGALLQGKTWTGRQGRRPLATTQAAQ